MESEDVREEGRKDGQKKKGEEEDYDADVP